MGHVWRPVPGWILAKYVGYASYTLIIIDFHRDPSISYLPLLFSQIKDTGFPNIDRLRDT